MKILKITFVVCLSFLVAINIFAQAPGAPYNWATQLGGTGATTGIFPGENVVVALKTDNQDNTFALLTYRGDLTLGGTTYTAPGSSSSALPYGVILIKYSSTGVFLWAAPLSDANKKFIRPNALAVDAEGNAIVGGEYLPTYASAGAPELDFGGGKTLTNSYQVVVAKYAAANGSCLFAKPFDITAPTRPTYLITLLDCDAANNIYFASNQQGGLIDEGSKLRKLDSNGELLWTVENEKSVQSQGGSVDLNGNIMIAFGLGTSSAQPASYRIGTVTFPVSLYGSGVTACFDSSGAVKWTKVFKNMVAARPIMDNNGNAYFVHPDNIENASNSPYSLLSYPGGGDYPIVKIDADGNLLKVKYRSYKNFNGMTNKLSINKTTGEVYLMGDYLASSGNAITHGDLVFSGVVNKRYIAILKYDTDLEEKGGHFGIASSSVITGFLTSTISDNNNIIVASHLSLSQTATIGATTFTGTKSKDAFLVSLQGNTITPPLFTKWKGINNNWNDAQNWDNGIPTADIKAQIPTGLSKYPTAFPTNPTVGIFEVQSGVTLTSLPSDLKVTALFRNNGSIALTLNNSSSAATFTGFGIDVEGTGTLSLIASGYAAFNWNTSYAIKQKLILNSNVVITLNSNMQANEIQLVGSAKIYTGTGSFQVKVLSNSPAALTGYDNTRYIYGTAGLYRAIATSGTYDFPVGDFNYYQPTKISFTDNTSVSYIVAKYASAAPTPASPPTSCAVNGEVITSYLTGLGTWTLTPNVAMSAGSYNIEITASASTGASADKIALIKRVNLSSPWTGAGNWVLTLKNTSSFPNTITAKLTGLTSFSDFAFGITTNPIPTTLPVNLTNFTAKAQNNSVLLTWQTSSEVNNGKFVIERSTDGQTFTSIAEVKGKGSKDTQANYYLVDNRPQKGFNYYRLKQVDFNGDFDYSQVEVVNMSLLGNAETLIYPNPANDYFNVFNAVGAVKQVQIFDLSGKKIMEVANPSSSIILPQSLLNGIYFVKIIMKNGEVANQKLQLKR